MAVGSTPVAEDTITFLFTDVEGSTRLWEEHRDTMRDAFARHDALLRHAIDANGGRVFKTVGDAFCAAFATAPAALQAALAAQRALLTSPPPGAPRLRVRMALHTGAAEAREEDYFGPALHRIARLLEAAHGDQVILSLATQELVRDLLPEGISLREMGEHRLRDLTRPERIYQLLAPDLPSDFAPLRTLNRHRHNLPAQMTTLIGRDAEVAALRDLLAGATSAGVPRLVTLTGPGGTGKTRLALQAAAELLDAFPDGVYFVPLAPISDPGLVATTIAKALGIHEGEGRDPADRLQEYLKEMHVLLALDNFEQILPAAPLVLELLTAAPRLTVLATSRAPLRLRGERQFPVAPLSLPPTGMAHEQASIDLAGLTQFASVRLFIQRAVDVRPEFTITNESAPFVAEICHRLDGLPLAIELAAARIKLFSPQTLLSRLTGAPPPTPSGSSLGAALRFLTAGTRDMSARHQTLRSAISWSHELLAEHEKRLFHRLAVFVGGFTLEAAEQICAESLGSDVFDVVAALVEQSLLRQRDDPSGEPRFEMLETIREFAREQLEASGEAGILRQRHARHFMQLAEIADPEAHQPGQIRWLRILDMEHDNMRAALDWAGERKDAEVALRLSAALGEFWSLRGHHVESIARYRELLHWTGTERTPARVKCLYYVGKHLLNCGDIANGLSFVQEALALAREIDDREGIAWALSYGGEGPDKHEEILRIFRELNNPWGIGHTLILIGAHHYQRHEPATARPYLEEGVATVRRIGHKAGEGWGLGFLAYVAELEGDLEAARSLSAQSLTVDREVGHSLRIADGLWSMARFSELDGDLIAARAGYEEAFENVRRTGYTGFTMEVRSFLGRLAGREGDTAAARSILSESLAWFRGRGDAHMEAWCLQSLAETSRDEGRPDRAARIFGAVDALRETKGVQVWGLGRIYYKRLADSLHAALGDDAFAAARAEGRAMPLDDAISLALSDGVPETC